jgi:phosphatidylinositol 4-kinase
LHYFFFVALRCRKSADFSLKCAWLLDAYSSDAHLPSKKKSHGTKLKNLILSDELRPKEMDTVLARRSRVSTGGPGPDYSKMKELASPTIPLSPPPPPPPPPPPLPPATPVTSPNKKTHQRSRSDATGLYSGHRRMLPSGNLLLSCTHFYVYILCLVNLGLWNILETLSTKLRNRMEGMDWIDLA